MPASICIMRDMTHTLTRREFLKSAGAFAASLAMFPGKKLLHGGTEAHGVLASEYKLPDFDKELAAPFEFPMQFDEPIYDASERYRDANLIDRDGRLSDVPEWYRKQIAPYLNLSNKGAVVNKRMANAIAHPHAYNLTIEYKPSFKPDVVEVNKSLEIDFANVRGQ